jgi:hypothetical protein
MRKLTQDELNESIAKHRLWLSGEYDGEKLSIDNCDLSGLDLSNAFLRYTNLSHSILSNSKLNNSDLSYSNLSNSKLSNSDLRDSNLSNSNLGNSDLSYSDLRNSNLSFSNLSNSILSNSDLRYSNLSYSDLRNSFLSNAFLMYTNLSHSNLSNAVRFNQTIKKFKRFDNLYRYDNEIIINTENKVFWGFGCFFRSLEDWEKDFWNNPTEFPNDGSEKSKRRWNAFLFLKNEVELMLNNNQGT